jgi:hypothetical protein
VNGKTIDQKEAKKRPRRGQGMIKGRLRVGHREAQGEVRGVIEGQRGPWRGNAESKTG